MENPARGPWGRNPQDLDRISRYEIGVEDGPFIETVLKTMLEQLARLAGERGIDFRGSIKTGLPGVLTLEQKTGDISELLDRAKEMIANVNALEEVKNRRMEFMADYVPVSQRVPTPAIVVSGITSR